MRTRVVVDAVEGVAEVVGQGIGGGELMVGADHELGRDRRAVYERRV